jgi:AraC-like DNA-binding protein
MSFGGWKRQARLLFALKRLAHGDPVTAVALDAGYSSPSAFTYMFRRVLGSSPSVYFNKATSTMERTIMSGAKKTEPRRKSRK